MEPELELLQAQIDNNPAVQAALRQAEELRRRGTAPAQIEATLLPILRQQGIEIPPEYRISVGETGRVGELVPFQDRSAPTTFREAAERIVGGGGASTADLVSDPNMNFTPFAPPVEPEGPSFGNEPTLPSGPGPGGGFPEYQGPVSPEGPGFGFEPPVLPGSPNTTITPYAPTVTPNSPNAGSGGGSRFLDWLKNTGVSNAGPALSAASKGQSQERGQQNTFEQNQDRIRDSQFSTAQNAATRAREAEERGKLDRAELGLRAPDIRGRQALLSSLVQHMKPVTFGDTGRIKVPTIQGGLTPDAFSPELRAAMSDMETQAIDAMLSGSDVPAETDFQGARLTPPPTTPYQQPGTGESVLAGLGIASSVWDWVQQNLREQSQTPTTLAPTQPNRNQRPAPFGPSGGQGEEAF